MSRRIAVIGLGQMGSAVARRLMDRGYDVSGYDIYGPARDKMTAQGAQVGSNIAAAIAECDVIITSLPNSAIVSDAFLSEDGILANAKADATIIELSTIEPNSMRQLGDATRKAGHKILDCPVSGRPADALEGKLTLLVGGDEVIAAEVGDVLEALGGTGWHWTGDIGTAKVIKIINNMMSLGNVLVAAEAFALGAAAGVDAARLYEILTKCGGRSHHFVMRFPNAVKSNWEPGFKVELAEKDLWLGLELARSLKMPAPAASIGHNVYAMASAAGLAEKDIVSLVSLYQSWLAPS